MQLEKPFKDYSKEEQYQIMFQALRETKADRDYFEAELDKESHRANQATIAQHIHSQWNYALWALVFISFMLGYLLRGF
ncbi:MULTISPECIES: hypothetical protein [Burkholderia cepacia complex]|uniref:hypothetical protein n=1 Tax=Burkholderia cenocepacia TaxID=95486 RepID=UPI00223816CB|nr:hypothetical protein [Burkholderia cenocepacia]MCW5156403.1 hypothetical protein [Burkholderia cenocepacia]